LKLISCQYFKGIFIYLNDKGLHDFEKRMIITMQVIGRAEPSREVINRKPFTDLLNSVIHVNAIIL
jgi:hypothetical protein